MVVYVPQYAAGGGGISMLKLGFETDTYNILISLEKSKNAARYLYYKSPTIDE